jgi:hypothetical protein
MRRGGAAIAKRDTFHEGEGLGKAGEVKTKGKERPFAWQVDIRWRSWIVHV